MDYDELGLKAGLEIHQQLDTESKLFCGCPTELRKEDDAVRKFERYLHPTKSELGELDDAALEESMIDRVFRYRSYDSTCLVEEDEEPPHPIDNEAIETALEAAELMDMTRVDQAHVMRKLVIDGSNTSGFQRTSLVAYDGVVETSEGDVGVDSMSVEEESAQRLGEFEGGVEFSLDRLGIPLVEIGTDPDIRSPSQAQETAEKIGMYLRSTGKVKRGLGTIRQDLNVSIEDGARIEMKGVQALDMIGELVEHEVERQFNLVEIASDLRERDAEVDEPQDVTEVFEDTDSGIISGAVEGGGAVYGVRLGGFDGLVGREVQTDRRLGTELSDRAKKMGAGGLFHTDELPGYGITEEEVSELRDAVDAEVEDAVAIVADSEEVARKAAEAAQDRAEQAIEGVPEETRDANSDGTSSYLRPLPGAARMYPETDVLPVDLHEVHVEQPDLLSERSERYVEDHCLGEDLAQQVAFGEWMPVYEEAVEEGVDPTLAAQTLEGTLTELRRDEVDVESLDGDDLLGCFRLVDQDEVAKEGLPDLIESVAEHGEPPAELLEELDLGSAQEDEVAEAVEDVLDRKQDLIDEEGMGAFSGLMGVVMGELRGKADGELVSDVLREKIQERM
ncbi:MAG: Glu-tRNA(Gln) amidotransferase subunit GatE [Halobacteria archaeon]